MKSLCIVLAVCAISATGLVNTFSMRAILGLDRLITCNFQPGSGFFTDEGMWQSGNTMETLSNLLLSTKLVNWSTVLGTAFDKTPPIVDNCFDDHQWWLLAWIQAYKVTGRLDFLQRAAYVFDFTIEHAWTSDCGGGIIWCPSEELAFKRMKGNYSNINGGYKNAITNELFLSSAMGLHPYTALLGRPANFYLSWAIKEWQWLDASGMRNSKGLFNDGLDSNCKNNGQTTWTYNQGVLLDGLGALSVATGNNSIADVAYSVARATMAQLTSSGILVEPCNGPCDGDQHLFKGIFVRHLSYFTKNFSFPDAEAFLSNNALSILFNDTCVANYGLNWQGPCDDAVDSATLSAAIDAFIAAAPFTTVTSKWQPAGLGNCMDAAGRSMPNCFKDGLQFESDCLHAASSMAGAVAYDFEIPCHGLNFCRIRTLAGASSCPQGWGYDGSGGAINVTAGNGNSLTVCVVDTSQIHLY